jgi:ABC-type Mn2+/Zn2+ transport system ATPase subunit
MNQIFDKVLSEMEILPLKRALVREISGGERQRALIARAWVSRPKAMLMDEPFNSLDYRFKEKLWGIFQAWQQSHELTLVIIDHDLNRLINQVDRLIVLGPQATLCGKTAEILQPELLSRAYGAPVHVHQEDGIHQVHFL